jgi:threonine/homoserine/homoserine lactone efflux protein
MDTVAPARNTVAARSDSDGTAVASFILGLLGTFVFNVVFGPLALILGTISLARGTRRRGRALLGIALGLADLVILAVLIGTHQSISWTPGF